jgi:hypothetical protein
MFLLIAFSLVLGVCWHAIVVMIVGRPLAEALSWEMAAGALAGLVAGLFTVWSRRRRSGRESIGFVLATYYLAMVVYWFSGTCIDVSLQLLRDGRLRQFYWARLPDDFTWMAVYGTMYGVVLIPLCWMTRHILWQWYGRIRPNWPQQPTRPQAGARLSG